MAEKKYRPLRIYRSSEVQESREAALVKLNEAANLVGQPVMIKYWADPETKKKIDILVALGVQDGKGPGTYQVIATGGVLITIDVSTELPDVAQLVHGENYIYYDTETSTTYLVYLDDPERKYQKITEPQTVISLATGKTWYIGPDFIKEATDWYTTTEVDEFVKTAQENLKKAQASLEKDIKAVDTQRALDKTELQENIDTLAEKEAEDIHTLSISVWPVQVEYFRFKTTPEDLYENGKSVELEFEYKITRNGEDVTSDCQEVRINDTLVSGGTGKLVVTGDSEFSLSATYNSELSCTTTPDQTLKVIFGTRVYWSTVPEDYDVSGISDFSGWNSGLIRLGYSDISDIFDLDGENRVIYASPGSLGKIEHIYDWSGLDYINDYTETSITLGGSKTYNIYLKDTLVEITDFKQRFVYGN
jgi:hypothetical protein